MTPRLPSTPTLVEALLILAIEIESPDGVANAAIREAAARLRSMTDPQPILCPCGRIAHYQLRDQASCNKYVVCPTYDELKHEALALSALVIAYRKKRLVDGLNGREWNAAKHFAAESQIETLEATE